MAWARAAGLALLPIVASEIEANPALTRALADGIERGHAAAVPPLPAGGEWYLIRRGHDDVGVLALRRGCGAPDTTALLAVAIAPEHRGAALGMHALLLAERALAREGQRRLIARVPRTNGHGLYFMLRAGLTPTAARADDDATWFARRAAPAGYRLPARRSAR